MLRNVWLSFPYDDISQQAEFDTSCTKRSRINLISGPPGQGSRSVELHHSGWFGTRHYSSRPLCLGFPIATPADATKFDASCRLQPLMSGKQTSAIVGRLHALPLCNVLQLYLTLLHLRLRLQHFRTNSKMHHHPAGRRCRSGVAAAFWVDLR
jgi:hypothetical protein